MSIKVLLKIVLMLFFVNQGICEDYACGFTEGMTDCKNFENDIMDASNMELGKAKSDDEEAMYMEGWIELKDPIKEGYMFEVDIAKETEMGSEPMWSCSMDVCQSIQDKDAPWSAALKSLGIETCPIETGKYYCTNMTIDMSSLKDKMTHQFEGKYEIIMKITNDKMDTMSCNNLGVAIVDMDKE